MTFFFFNDTATTEIYTLSLHDALPIFCGCDPAIPIFLTSKAQEQGYFPEWIITGAGFIDLDVLGQLYQQEDRKSTRLNSSHANISYAVFCLKKKKNINELNYILLCTTT